MRVIILTDMHPTPNAALPLGMHAAKRLLTERAYAFGFDALGVSGIELTEDEQHLIRWLGAGFHGDMDYMQRHGTVRSRPQELADGTTRVVSVRMNYWPAGSHDAQATLD